MQREIRILVHFRGSVRLSKSKMHSLSSLMALIVKAKLSNS